MKERETNNHLENIAEIRSIMERSSGFLSLSGLSGIFAGSFALLGAGFAYYYIKYVAGKKLLPSLVIDKELMLVLIADGIAVLALALFFGFLMTRRNTLRKGLPIKSSASHRMLTNLAIPLTAGGLTVFLFIIKGIYSPIPGLLLIFYGLALVNASKYTLHDIRYLGLIETALGLITLWLTGYALLLWALGFGVLHIIYGTLMYLKYERGQNKK
jgi:predicted lysophospholipase L1 biosynthesis ABC-type transport system permease subunit